MNYHPKSRSRSNRRRLLAILVAVFIFGSILTHFLGGGIASLISPIWKGENIVARKISLIGSHFRFESSLINENNSLRDRIASLEAELANRSPMSLEESAVLAAFGRTGIATGIAASVLVRPPQTPYDVVVIDVGEGEGARVGMEASMPEGPIVGVVEEASFKTSKVSLFSSPGTKTNAVLERTGLVVTLEGAGGGNFRVLVPRDTAVERGDRILSADVSARLLAIVGDIELEETDSEKLILASGPSSMFNLRFIILR